MDAGWEFWIDVGGTFTDCVGRAPDGTLRTCKLLSTGAFLGVTASGSTGHTIIDSERKRDPQHFFNGWTLSLSLPDGSSFTSLVRSFDNATGQLELETPLPADAQIGLRYELRSSLEAPVAGVRWLLARPMSETVGAVRIRLGTTRGTNALLERQGARTAFITTRGFRDVLRIAFQNRPRLFELEIRKPEDLYASVVEVNERLDAQGTVLEPVDESHLRTHLQALKSQGIESLAVCLLHSYRNPAHEQRIRAVAETLEFKHISLSSELSPLPRIVPRGDTTLADAYLTPILRAYVATLEQQLPAAQWRFMTSAGSLVTGSRFQGRDSVLSGPAGGVVGIAHVAEQAGLAEVIGFDMGGTSTDVSRYDGEYERRYEMALEDPQSGGAVRIVAPMLSVETVAAGGGSICWFDGQKPMVGPRSAGASPGPACYGRGGPLSITDINLFLGHVVTDHFPFPLDETAVLIRLDEMIAQIAAQTGKTYTREELAEGFARIANANMAAPIKRISTARGYDVRRYALVSFGGAGSQHACAIARELGMRQVICSPFAGVLSALGMGHARMTRFCERAIGQPLEQIANGNALSRLFNELADQGRTELQAEGVSLKKIGTPKHLLDLRYTGQDTRLTINEPADGNWRQAFETAHQQLYGFTFPKRAVEAYAARIEIGEQVQPRTETHQKFTPRTPQPVRITNSGFNGHRMATGVYHREQLQPGDHITGPAIIAEAIATIVIEPGWRAEITAHDNILLHWQGTKAAGETAPTETSDYTIADPVELELFNNAFASIAAQMGATLERTALSTNVKERLDFSCAIFTPEGELVVNAPHIPVHLGAMSECVKHLCAEFPDLQPGDVLVTNDPYRGGSHLPDVTVVTPVFVGESSHTPAFFVASRAHHAEIGGITPGSMPPFSQSLAEEGVLIRPLKLRLNNPASESTLRQILTEAPYPTRSVEENLADLHAQMAANQTGFRLLLELTARESTPKVQAYMRHIQHAAENKVRAALSAIPAGEYHFSDSLDNGAKLTVSISLQHGAKGGEAVIDFTGTDAVLPNNFNANRAIVTSAVIYCLRCLLREPIPLNAGVLAPVIIKLPENCLLNPTPNDDPTQCPPVVAGNVETSQRIVDVILGALGIVAASQGTMNNFLFGRPAKDGQSGFGYYETIGGGAGASANTDGGSAVHTHMTNTRLTDPEVLEMRYPVRLRRCEIRHASGGIGQHRGGDGMIRELEFLAPLEVSLLTSRRTTRPYGLQGGQPGLSGHNLLRLAGETSFTDLGSTAFLPVKSGDVLRLETPGGGGFGRYQSPKILYFAYGSNTDPEQMRERCPGAKMLPTAELPGYRWIINTDGYATVIPAPGETVYGVLWDLQVAHLAKLDLYEAVPQGLYWREEISVVTRDTQEVVPCLIYFARSQQEGRPVPDYMEHILRCARDFGFPESYIHQLAQFD